MLREAITAGMKTLTADADHLRRKRQELRDQATIRLSATVEELVASMRAEAEQLGDRMAQLFADACLLRFAAASLPATDLSGSLDYVCNGLAVGRLISRGPIPARPELVAVLEKNIAALRIAGTTITPKHRASMM